MSTDIQKAENRSPVPVVNGELCPPDFDGVQRLAGWLHATGMLPHGVTTIAQVALIVAKGMAVGVGPVQALENIMVVNNRCTVWGDLAMALVRASGKAGPIVETIEGDGESRVAVCEATRLHQSGSEVIRRTFSVRDAKDAGLWGKAGPWKLYPSRMLQMRARAFALRDGFADVLKGLSIREEFDDVEPTPTVRVVTNEVPGQNAAPRASLADKIAKLSSDSAPESESSGTHAAVVTVGEIDGIFSAGENK